MPMIDAFIPEGALTAAAERELCARLTDIVLAAEESDPGNPLVRSLAWVFVHRPAAVYVGGEPADAPRYKVVASVQEGQFDAERRAGFVAAVTEAVLDAEDGAYPRNPMRVWVIASEIPEGTWAGGGRIAGLAEVVGLMVGDADRGRAYAEDRFGARLAATGG